MKHLANCTPTEFLKQTVMLRGPFSAWLERTGIPEIRKRRPEGFDDMSPADRAKAIEEQGAANMGDILVAALEKDFDGTIEVMALACFTDPKDVDAHPMTEYLDAILEMFQSEAVRGFFTYLLKATPRTSGKG